MLTGRGCLYFEDLEGQTFHLKNIHDCLDSKTDFCKNKIVKKDHFLTQPIIDFFGCRSMKTILPNQKGGEAMNRKKFLIVILTLCNLVFTPVAFAQEEEDKPTCSSSLGFYSQYIWRGFELSKESLVIFPSITVSYKGFGFNVWGDFDTDYYGANTGNNSTEWWETDMVLTYGNSFSITPNVNVDWTLGWIYYDTDAGDDEEVFGVLGLDTLLAPKISVYRGIEYGESWYINLAVSHSFPLNDCGLTLDVGGWGSYNDIERDDYSAFHDGTVWVGMTIPVTKWCTAAPAINYTFPLSSEADDYLKAASFDGDDSDFVYGGVTFNVTF
jgi:hypothetical protein